MLPSHMEPSVCPSAGRVGVCYNWDEEDILGKGGGISVTWGLFVVKGHPCQNDPSVVSSFTSGWGGRDRVRTGTAPTAHWRHWECHPPVPLLMKTLVGGRNCFHYWGAVILSWITLRGTSGYPSRVPQSIGMWRSPGGQIGDTGQPE